MRIITFLKSKGQKESKEDREKKLKKLKSKSKSEWKKFNLIMNF